MTDNTPLFGQGSAPSRLMPSHPDSSLRVNGVSKPIQTPQAQPIPETLAHTPVVQAPVVQQPVVQAPVVQQPVVQAPVVQQPVVTQQVVQQPVVTQQVVQQPVVQQPVVQQPIVQAPVAQPVTQQPVVAQQVMQQQVVQQQVVQPPVPNPNLNSPVANTQNPAVLDHALAQQSSQPPPPHSIPSNTTSGSVEDRVARRARSLKGGVIILPGQMRSSYACKIRNESTTGVMLAIPNTMIIPDEFYLMRNSDPGRQTPCRVAWRTADKIGVEFVMQLTNP